MSLVEYRKKRRFDKTTEPAGKQAVTKQSKRLSFVIQKHAATRLHYDFRIELDGTLKSWAVPKGPAFDPTEKRLAVEVEDHPLEYAKFEGQIPKGQYGAGEVIVWDRGTWTPLGDPHEGLRTGKLEFELHGEKLRGRWVLVRLQGRQRSDKPNWLLIKRRDKFARPLTEYDVTIDKPRSVKTRRTLEDLAAKVARSKPIKRTAPGAATKTLPRKKSRHTTIRTNMPPLGSIDVELATLTERVPTGDEWLHEIKFDGYRLICQVQRGQVKLMTRGHQDWTHRYRSIQSAAARLPIQSAILDGELVALLPSGISSFQALQNAGQPGSTKLVYYVFDLLFLNGQDLRPLPLAERKRRLRDVLPAADGDVIQYSDHLDTDGPAFFRESCQLGLEGIISKRRDRPYLAGRNGDWVKVKCLGREEFVIGGFTLSTADRRGIGALLVGYFEDNQLIYAGRVGTGFTAQTLMDMRQRLEMVRQSTCPFAAVPAKERGPLVKWVKPQLVAEIQFAAWTAGGILRHPSFQGLREDKTATEVQRPTSLALASPKNTMPRPKPANGTHSTSLPRGRRTSSAKSTKLPVHFTHPERILYPDTGLTKLGLANFYIQIAPWILPHIVDRPLSLVRCPAGQSGKCFFQKNAGLGTPQELGRVPIDESEGTTEYVFVRDLPGLLALVQMSVLEIHPWGSRRDRVEKPDRLTFDLDPGPGVSWQQVVDAAMATREVLAEHELESFVKTTGGKGLHVVVPISPRRFDWPKAKRFCKHLAGLLAGRHPKLYTITMAKAARTSRIFIDYLRNDRGSTAVAAYSTRARPGGPVSTPLAWNELNAATQSDHFNVSNLPSRLASLRRDPWAKIDLIKQSIPAIE